MGVGAGLLGLLAGGGEGRSFLLWPMGSCLWRRGGTLLAGLGAAFEGLS